ncbi:MAG: nickel pincer cofactor biosynthesis protein LarC [Candidatus Scalindua sp.]|nr:nickel pincer cofactor biosynthesis protein LarC [Candidatus Scalindua sp.]MCR4344384.1 nickel pincer cofactor biosynthesis protein LarC [Candidatus Scalindua sp.]
MKIVYFDCFSGASGDMILGALIDAGFNQKELTEELKKLGINNYELSSRKVLRSAITGTKFDVLIKEDTANDEHHRRRTLKDISTLINESSLSESIKRDSIRIFENLANAEAKVHNTLPEEVHFHEVGAIDSIVDIVGAVIAFDRLKIENIYFSPIRTGTGFVKCHHGQFPVPAPATIEILKGQHVIGTNIQRELTTPTGAAILTTLGVSVEMCPEITLHQIGYGAGSHEIPQIPNLLRVMIGETVTVTEQDEAWMLETNIDDMPGEHFGYLLEKILDAGALDGFLTPVQMKKSRPGTLISVLVDDVHLSKVERIIFEQSTTFGIRKYKVNRKKLNRKFIDVKTEYGMIKVKIGMLNGCVKNITPEHEDCRKIADAKELPLKLVYNAAINAAQLIKDKT